jgi:UDP-N-acetylglucosamine:LPS N-acetylglucosamine transferase
LVLIFGCGSNKSNITALVVPSLEHILSLKLHDAELGFSFISVFRLHFKISFSLSLSYLIRLNFISSTVLHVLQGFDVQAAVSTSFFSWVSVIFSRANSNPAI